MLEEVNYMATSSENLMIDRIQISTPLGKGKLALTGFSVTEKMSEPFSIVVLMHAVDSKIKLDDLIGKSVSISLSCTRESKKYLREFHGFITHIESDGVQTLDTDSAEKFIRYKAMIVPKVAFMENRINCRIFQNKSVIDICSDLFGQHKVAFKDSTKGSHPKYEYCVQYQETDLAFISRILEQEGIFYYFDHTKKEHMLILINDVSSYVKCDQSEITHRPSDHFSEVDTWSGGLTMTSGAYSQLGYDYTRPKGLPSGKSVVASLPDQNAYEIYKFVGESELNKRAEPIANIRLEAVQKDMRKCFGTSSCISFLVGKLFTFKDHLDPNYVGKTFMLTSVITEASNKTGIYKNHFECVPEDTPYRPVLLREKPLINGIQTAVVTGEKGDEILVDKYGRVKVQFHWDREGKKDSSSSCWIRVSQNWAGNGWGAFFYPHVGQEVIVNFVNGDPDQPIIIGAINNVDYMPPYELPAKKTQSGIKTKSTKNGQSDNFNELRFEDEKGKELFALQAEKDYEIVIKNDSTTKVLNNSTESVTKVQTIEVGENRTVSVKKNDELTVEGTSSTKIDGEYKLELGAAQTVTVASNDSLEVKGTRSAISTQDHTLESKMKLTIKAGTELSFEVGLASIKLSANGQVDIKGTDISITGSKIAQKAAMIQLN